MVHVVQPSRQLPRRFRPRGTDSDSASVSAAVEALHGNCDGWMLIEGDDVLTPQVRERHAAWEHVQSVQSTVEFSDPAFPPCPRTVDGKDTPTDSKCDLFRATLSEHTVAARPVEPPPPCLCGRPATRGVLRGDGPSKGRPVWRCAGRACNFFELADGGPSLAAAELVWERCLPPKWNVVGDGGFRPEDLRQGAVGDCWFMSALAVVAERHDLLEKLLPNLNEGAHLGCHEVRLFLDGRWVAYLLDSNFPMAAPDKQKRRDETGLAFGRAADYQLWVPLVEKAYARAHGSYKAISGGQVAEAMLDLTGCPTESINFRVPGFDKELFWCRLLSFLEARFPIGCGTSAETVEELGLVGQHAYSVLEAGERYLEAAHGETCTARMVKVRNPWGAWTQKENDRVLQALGAAITGDGAFWMPYDDFVRGFAVIDVCKARLGWHARSFEVAFGGCATGRTGARKMLRLRAAEVSSECHIVAVQPTERGAKHRQPPGYLLNDVSFALLDSKTGGLVALTMGGARRDVASEDSLLLDAGREYLVVPFSFKARPGSCVLRVCTAQPLTASVADTSPKAAEWLWHAVHSYVAAPPRTLGSRVQRMAHRLQCSSTGFPVGALVVLEGESLALGVVSNEQSEAMSICVMLEANQMIACTAGGTFEGQPRDERREAKATRPRQSAGRKGKGKGKEAPEDWREFACEALVPPESQQLLFTMVPVARMRGDYDLSLMEVRVARQPRGDGDEASASGAFAPVALRMKSSEPEDTDLLAALAASLSEGMSLPAPHPAHDSDEDADDAALELALALSRQETDEEQSAPASMPVPATPPMHEADEEDADDAALELALALSLQKTEEEKLHTSPAAAQEAQRGGRWNRRHAALT